MKLCQACQRRACEDRGPDCDDNAVCQCPCALVDTPADLAAFAHQLRSVPYPEEGVRHG